MPWKVKPVKEQRIEFVVRVLQQEKSIKSLCSEYGISRSTGHKWLRRYRQRGTFDALSDGSRRPHRVPHRTAPWKERKVAELRERYGWGARKLKVLLQREGVKLSERTINRILKRGGWVSDRKVTRPATKRFERAEPNQLWQMDFKGEYKLEEGGKCYPLSIVDDHSRYCVGMYSLRKPQGDAVWKKVRTVFTQYGVPQAMLLDHGSPWWASANSIGLSQLGVRLIEQGIRLMWSGRGHPQTQGKVERLHQTLAQALKHRGRPPQEFSQWQPLLSEIRYEYNQIRPHEALQMQTPAARYRTSSKRFQEKPLRWKYPVGWRSMHIDASGSLYWNRVRYFVSMALCGHQVGVLAVDNRLLVRYRQMYLCEVDLRKRKVKSWIKP